MIAFGRRIAVLDVTGAAFVFYATRYEAEYLVDARLATAESTNQLRLTQNAEKPRGFGEPLYLDGLTHMLARPLEQRSEYRPGASGSYVRWK